MDAYGVGLAKAFGAMGMKQRPIRFVFEHDSEAFPDKVFAQALKDHPPFAFAVFLQPIFNGGYRAVCCVRHHIQDIFAVRRAAPFPGCALLPPVDNRSALAPGFR